MKSLTKYIVRLIEEDAEQVVGDLELITLPDDVYDRFIAACDTNRPTCR